MPLPLVDFPYDTTRAALLAFAAPDHILYGSDFSMLAEAWGTDTALDAYPNWEPGRLHAIDRGNAELLVPRLARTPVT
ncbi:hypothetical protein [Streptomyces chartreusis]|uniref:hypothetical protein n=1 Tax=Streptomyces chartreusis TaxID=1969 RepID=UPI0033DF3BDC